MATSLLVSNCSCHASCCRRGSSPSPSPLLPLPLAPRKPAWWSPLSHCGTQDWSAVLSLADPPPPPPPSSLLCSSHAELLQRRESEPQKENDGAAVADSTLEAAAPGEAKREEEQKAKEAPRANSDKNDDPTRKRRPFRLFTEEKARLLRHAMLESEAWRDTMYHSAIASRLASSRP